MLGMFRWVFKTRVQEDRADDTIVDVEAARHPNQPRLEEARRRWIDQRTLYHPDDFYRESGR